MTSLTVWHDGICPLCRAEISLMRRPNTRGAIYFVDATKLLARLPIVLQAFETANLGFLRVRPALQWVVRRVVLK